MLKLSIILGICAVIGCEGASKLIVCQYNSWAPYRTAPGNFSPAMMDPTLCSHGVYEFAAYNKQTDAISHSNNHDLDAADGTAGGYRQMVELKSRNPDFKPMLGLGGAGAGYDIFSKMANDSGRRAVFIQNVIEYVHLHKFEGLELDWVSPRYLEDMENFGTLLSEMRVAFDTEGLILSASLHAIPYVNNALDVISNACHFVILMTYDYYGPWWLVTAHSAPLLNSYYSVDYSVQEYKKYLVDPTKTVVSIPAYGRSYTLVDPEEHLLGSKANDTGAAGPYTGIFGWLSYNEIALDIESWTTVRDEVAQAAYSYKGDQWVSYDDTTTVRAKAQYVNEMNLAGVALWSVDEDNFLGGFTLLQAINESLD